MHRALGLARLIGEVRATEKRGPILVTADGRTKSIPNADPDARVLII